MIKYKIVESSIPHLKGIELDFDFSNYSTGDEISILGLKLNITQIGQGVIGTANSENILIFQNL